LDYWKKLFWTAIPEEEEGKYQIAGCDKKCAKREMGFLAHERGLYGKEARKKPDGVK
jgi:ABC-type uncharacterized transport system ATPase subunit